MAPWAKAIGLADPRVDICNDRGNQYYDEDHPFERPSTKIEPQDGGHTIFEIIRDELEAKEVKKGKNSFIPRGSLQKIFTPGRLLAVIQELWKDLSEKDQQRLCVRVLCDVRCWKVFLLFVYAELEKFLPQFWKNENGKDTLRLSDRCLPLVSITPDGRITCQNKTHSHRFPGCETKKLSRKERRYMEEASYALSAVYLKLPKNGSKTHVHYCLGPNDALPYTIIPCASPARNRSISGRTTTAGKADDAKGKGDTTTNDNPNGGFGEITRVIIDPSHYNFGHLGVSPERAQAPILLYDRSPYLLRLLTVCFFRAMMARTPRPLPSKSFTPPTKMLSIRS